MIKNFKASMLVEERDILFKCASVQIGYSLYQSYPGMKSIFKQNAKISKSGDDNSDLLELYEDIMSTKI